MKTKASETTEPAKTYGTARESAACNLVPLPPDWPQLNDEALNGLPKEIVRAIDPFTEADPVAVLTTLLRASAISSAMCHISQLSSTVTAAEPWGKLG
jgi:hypothetical protein